MRLFAALFLSFFTISASAQLGVPPIITVPPIGISVLKHDNTTLLVVAVSLTTPSYQWYKDGTKITGQTSSTLTLSKVQQQDAGSYYVVVKNAAGSVTSPNATLIVLDKLQTVFKVSKFLKKSNGFQIQSTSVTTPTCVVYASQDLTHWTPISTNAVSGNSMTYTDPQATNLTFRYYKVCDQ